MSLTPQQFNKLVTKEESKNFATKEDVQESKREIIEILESIATDIKDIKIEQAANIGAHDRFSRLFEEQEKTLKKHEKRLERLEARFA